MKTNEHACPRSLEIRHISDVLAHSLCVSQCHGDEDDTPHRGEWGKDVG